MLNFSLGKLGKRLQYSLLFSTITIMLMVVFCIVGVRFSLNENIKEQMALDRIDDSMNTFYKSIIDQETGQRGYNLTENESFLKPYYQSEEVFSENIIELRKHAADFPEIQNEVNDVIQQGEYWHNQFITPIVEQSLKGQQPSIEFLEAEKLALDGFRRSYASFTEKIEEQRSIVREKMKTRINLTFTILVVISIGTLLINLLLNFKILRSIIKPIINLSDCVNSYAQHDFEKNVPVYHEKDELNVLIENVDAMRDELSKKIRTLELKANVDGLTGLYNRRFFDDFLQKQWKIMLKQFAQISLIMFDIDYFKKYNDTYGHLAGDDCLKIISQALQNFNESPFNLAARYGGEEFCIIVLHHSKEEVLKIAKEISNTVLALKIPHKNSQVHQNVTVSIGVATVIPNEEITPNDLISFADHALYQSKEKGKNCITQYEI
ncbi:sensor domain-containing diguanylate cyclase [Niallia endozanthoxylica]|uniref:Diguanylate cyclase n=1 Tax=Niallia endozanthoxylica TaxID=2036016 RepID=A0A5J5H7U9_9BACI|nr:diguanylate cyclase [Niallia endozanthoxylica]KAA9016028.1 diguanylate cyclase [Niallia endozanthoxylica]